MRMSYFQRLVFDLWMSGDKPTQRAIALKLGSSQQSVSRALREAQRRRYGKVMKAPVRVRLVQLSVCFNV